MSKRKKRGILGTILSLAIVAVIFIIHTIVYSDDSMYFSIESLMNRSEPPMGYAIGNPTQGGSKIWNIVKRSGTNTDDIIPGYFYCLKAGVGFTNLNENVKYDIFYDLKEEKDKIRTYFTGKGYLDIDDLLLNMQYINDNLTEVNPNKWKNYKLRMKW